MGKLGFSCRREARFWIILLFLCGILEATTEPQNVSTIRNKRSIKSASLYGGSSRTLCEQPTAPRNGGLGCNVNARRMYCTATCLHGFKFPDGTELKKHACNNYDGTWLPDMRFPDCEPICNPPCQNNGKCYGNDKCICTPQYRGDKCEYAISNCDGNSLHQTGNWACNHTNIETLCTISCPPGMQFEYPPANIYSCDLRGNWVPKYVPKCISMNIIVHPTLLPILEPVTETMVVSRERRSGVCATWSQLHYRTFDGSMFSMQGKCTYLLARDCSSDTFSIHVKNDPDCNGPYNCQRSVIIYVDNNKYTLEQTIKGPSVLWGRNRLRVPTVINGLLVEEIASYITVQSALGFTVKWNGKDLIMVQVSGDLFNKTCGLCGRFDGRDSNDFEMADGSTTTTIVALANSWKMNNIGEPCADATKLTHTCQYGSPANEYLSNKADDMCNRIMSREYAPCHILLDPKPYFEMCRLDFCACGEDGDKCACNSLTAYFQEFHRLGGKLQEGWRRPDLCPMQCPGNMIYQDCGSSCPKTCKKSAQLCSNEQCVDGCHCPPGTVLHNEQCIEEAQCPCYHSGKKYQNGDSIQQDCNACICEDGFWQCTKEKCDARCSSVGDPHYKTFDGKRYDFMGKCSYYLVHNDDLIIEQENVACSGAISENMGFVISPASDYPSCTKSVTIRIQGTVLQLKQRKQVVINGKEIHELPVSADGIHVFAMSSIYIKVDLENGISVTWDGASRVYIDAPVSFYDKTKGLCGTYNHNQKDDFLTNEGDIEQDTTAFANKWKVSESCQDIAISDKLKDPCEIFSQRRETAQLLCGKLKSEIFATCHDVIDPEPFYKDCMYDMCYCQTKMENCLCPAISDYAVECAKKNSAVAWRTNVRECGLNCPGGQVYQECGSSCKRSCTDIAYHTKCREQCVEGCNCPPGMTLNADGECIVISICPCIHGNKNFLPGHKDLRGNMTCECTNARWVCRPATESELSASYASSESRPVCSAAANMEYTDCVSDCTITCKNMHSSSKCESLTCKPGCRCQKGYVLDTKTTHCVKPTQCPCHHGGQSYGEGEMIQEDCNTCVCEGGTWKCEKKECPGICTAWGESHFKSFDGRMFEFHGDCDYVLVKGGEDKYEKFMAAIHNVPCGSSDVACSKSLTFTIGDEKVTLVSNKPLPKSVYGSRYLIRQVGLFVFIHADIGITVQWDKGTRIYVRADIRWKNKLDGLCGNFNDDESDDFQASDGGPPVVKSTIFGDSWRLHDYCPISKAINNTCDLHPQRKSWSLQQCSVLKSPLFRPCHSEVPFEPYLEKCMFDSCGCDMGGDCLCLCTALAAYAQECNIHGVGIQWRSQELCAIQCETSAKYTSCMSVCPSLTCETQYLYSSLEDTCGREACVEGCEPPPCPTDQIYNNDREFKCIPKGDCVSQPCTVINGQMYHEGEKIKDLKVADPCQTCYCRAGNIICLGKKCVEIPTLAPIISSSSPPTTENELDPICKQTGWTEWMNAFMPTFKNGGDYETFELLKKRQFSFCPVENMRHIECRTAATHKHYKETGQNVWCSLPEGLICENKDQPAVKLCQDYEIRIYCQCAAETSPTTITTTIATTIPQIQTECTAPGWTEWMNSREPDVNGEYEIIPELRKKYTFCPDAEIENIECRARARTGQTESQNIECTKDRGLVCKNLNSMLCQDYEVRFYCLCDETDCDYPRGMEFGSIQDHQISVSSFRTPATLGHKSRLNGNGAWSAGTAQKNQWIEVDLDEIQEITGIITQGNPNSDEWVTAFKMMHSEDGKQWHTIKKDANNDKIFVGNTDSNTAVKKMFDSAVTARYVRLVPQEWENWISLRMEILGCNRIVDKTTTQSPSTTTTDRAPTTAPTLATTGRTPFPYHCEKDGWTQWMNIDSPESTRQYEILNNNIGDVEPISELRFFYAFCANPTTVECRTSYTQKMAHLTGQKVKCDLDGIFCRNDQQTDKYCLDYEVRFYCECEEKTTTNPVLTTNSITISPCNENGWTEWMNTNNPTENVVGDIETYNSLRSKYSFCADDHIAGIECRVANKNISFTDAGQYGVVCDMNRGMQCLHSMQMSGQCKDYEVRFFCLCQETTTYIVIPTANQKTTVSEAILAPTVTSRNKNLSLPDAVCDSWTEWINMDTPDDDGDDTESLWKVENYNELCPKPVSYQCRDAQTKEIYYKTGQNFKERCNANGIVCKSIGQTCRDYEIRVFCMCPTPPPEPQCESGWTQWFDIDDPFIGEGDFEQILDIRQKYEFCPTDLITDVECQARSFSIGGGKRSGRLQIGKGNSKTGGKGGGIKASIRDGSTGGFNNWLDYTETGDIGVKCSKVIGLACYNNFQTKRKCRDYRIRFYCSCGKMTSKPPPTTRTTKEYTEETEEQTRIAEITTQTTPITFTPIPLDLCGWTTWLNVDKPDNFMNGDGDFETIERLQDIYNLCEKSAIGDIQCRLADSKISWETSGQHGIVCDTEHGLRCENRLQNGGCYDYEVRVFCMPEWCKGTTNLPSTETPETITTTPPCKPGLTWSDCAYQCDNMCQSFLYQSTLGDLCSINNTSPCIAGCIADECQQPNIWRDESTCVRPEECTCILEDGQILSPGEVLHIDECEQCQCIANNLHCDTSQACRLITSLPLNLSTNTNTAFSVFTPPVPIPNEEDECWTQWFNIDSPTINKAGDIEDLAAIRSLYIFCNQPIEIECRVAKKELHFKSKYTRQVTMDAGQNVTCDLNSGLVCWNRLNLKTGGCYDYEIRFFCPCATSAAPTTTPITATATAVVGECINGFTDWFSVHVPDDIGEYENVQDARIAGYHFCANYHITAMECQVKGSQISHDKSDDQGVICSFNEGLLCKNSKQLAYKKCSDYEIRFFCDCGYETTPAATVPTITELTVSPTTTSGECIDGFTDWFSNHVPDNIGEYENAQEIRLAGYRFCVNHHITAMECRVKDSQVPHDQSREQGVICNFSEGLLCENSKQLTGMKCSDYEIRFFCDCSLVGPETTSAIPITTTETTTATITEVPTTTSPLLVTTRPPCSYWSDWINEDKPWFGVGDKEYKPPRGFCEDGEIQDIECVLAENNIPHSESNGRDLQCSINKGFSCINKYQPSKMCNDYKIRYYCGCLTSTATSTLPTTTTETTTSTRGSKTTIIIVPPPSPTPTTECEDYFYYISNTEKPLPDSRLKASSSLSSETGPQSARLQSSNSPSLYAAWIPAVKDTNQYIQVDLIKPKMVYGIAIEGHPILHSWVTSYEVLFSKDNVAFSYVTSPDNSVQIFKGNYDNTHTATNHFGSPIEARYIRIIPKSWKNDIALRFDVLGCLQFKTTPIPTTTPKAPQCDEPMGVENSLLSDEQMTASSLRDYAHTAQEARLNGKSNWAPKTSDKSQFLEFNFMGPRIITGITSQGRENPNQWVTSYIVSYSNDGVEWTTVSEDSGVPQIFVANYDGSSAVTNNFNQLIRTTKLRIIPQTWHNWIALKVEITGCYEPYPTSPITTIATQTTEIEPTTTYCTEYVNDVVRNHEIEVSSSLAGIRSGAPRLALNTTEEYDTGGWVAGVSNKRQFVLIDYGSPLRLTGIITQGRNKHPEWVTDYKVQYSLNKNKWHNAIDELGNTVFPGNTDKDTPVQHFFTPTITARYIKIVPTRWHNWISMRLAILGCLMTEETSSTPSTPGEINEECYSYGPWLSLHVPQPGSPGDIEPIDEIISNSQLCKSPVRIQCRETMSQKPYNEMGQITTCDLTQGLACLNDDQADHNCYNYEARIACWSCDVTTESTTVLIPPIVLCPEIPETKRSSCPDTCPQGQQCNGQNCVDPLQCPCIRDGNMFNAGDIMETSSCEECICKLKGHSYCTNKTCPICSYGLEGVVNEACQCECKTCPEGEILCPTNQYCLGQGLWCDGVVDCPDDEKDCPTTIPPTQSTVPPTRCPPQPIPTCTPDTLLILLNPSDPCPIYNCAPIPTVPPIPPPVEKYYCEMNSNNFKTFDGFGYQYDICEHIIMQDKESNNFNVTVHNNCSDGSGQCTRNLVVNQDDQQIKVNKNLQVELNGMVYTDSQLIRLARKFTELTARIIGDSVIIRSSKYGYEVSWNSASSARIGVTEDLAHNVYGLCGLFSYTPNDDKTTPNGDLADTITEFGDSWSIGPQEQCSPLTCPAEVMAEAMAACNELQVAPFDSCNDIVDPSYYIQLCVSSICECLTNTNLTDKECRCKAYLPYVEACEMKNVAKIRYWRVKQSCLPNCPPGLVWFDCGSACERTCDNHQEYNTGNTTCTSDQCVSGCFCPAGMVRKGDHCVQPEKCQDCVCKGYGDPHYFTFDGQYYPFQGNCTYILAHDIVRPNEKHKFEVFATNEDCHEEPMTTCTVAVMVLFNDHIAHFRVNESVTFDGVQLYPSDFPFHAYGIHVESIPGRSISFSIPDIFLEVRYFELNYGFEVRLPSEVYFNKTEGLCGNCDLCKGNDLRCQDGKLTNDTDEFAFSWIAIPPEQFESANEICKLKESTECKPSLEQELCDRLLSEEFLPCHALVDPEDYLSSCRFDACHSINPTASICRSVTEYARKCAEFGICIQNWRTEDFCPYKCPDGMYFDQCGPKCPKSCKDITLNGWAPAQRDGKDIVPDMLDKLMLDQSLQQTLQELEDVCDSTPVDGCFCVDGKVLNNGECVDPILCETCDENGHKVGDSWQPDPCTSCTCTLKLTMECVKTECPSKPTCTTDEATVVIASDNTTCCDKYECVKKPGPCPQPNIPHCKNGEILKLHVNPANECPEYVCECNIGECPQLEMPQQLQVGEETSVIETDCCPTFKIVCNSENCPKKPTCAKNHILKEHDSPTSRCCPDYFCEPPPNVCLFAHQYDVIDGQEVRLKPGASIKKAYSPGDIWTDGFCRKCTCESGYGHYRHRCTVELCPKVEDYQDNKDYIWNTAKQPGLCCPKFTRTACVVDERIHTIGEEWDSPDGDKCKRYRCGNLPSGEAIKVERSITCLKNCNLGAEYVEPPESSAECCGKCEPMACVEGGQLHAIGEIWNSTTQKCFTAECRKVGDVIQTRYNGKVCPSIPPGCSQKIMDLAGCCEICNGTVKPENQHVSVCRPELMRPLQTIGMFKLFDNNVKCTNKKPILNMKACSGHCGSTSIYSSDEQDFVSKCQCCTPTKTERVTISLECTDRKKRPIEYTQPTECECTSACNPGTGQSEAEQLGQLKAIYK